MEARVQEYEVQLSLRLIVCSVAKLPGEAADCRAVTDAADL